MHTDGVVSSYSDRYDVLKKLCRQQLLLNESLKLELSKVSKLLQKVSHERDILINELLENHSNCGIQSYENKDFGTVQQRQQSSQPGAQKRSYSSPVGSHHIPTKSRKESITDISGFPGRSQGQTEFECRAAMDTGFEDLELPVTLRVKSPHRSPNISHFEGSQTHLSRACHSSDRTLHLPISSPSDVYANDASASDGVWPPTPTGSESPPSVTTLPRATKPNTLLANSLVVSSAPLLSQRPTLVTTQPPGTARFQSTGVGMAPPVKLTFSGPSRPRLITNVPLLGKAVPSVQQRPPLYTTSLIPGQQRIVIHASGGGSNVTQDYPRASVPTQNRIRNSP